MPLKTKAELLTTLTASASRIKQVRDAAQRLKLKESAFETEPSRGAQSNVTPSNLFQGQNKG